MFQVEPILWLQDLGGDPWRTAMAVVSALGRSGAYAAVLLVLAFVVRLRPALTLVFLLLCTGIAVDLLKEGFALPRPEHVDGRVGDAGAAVVTRGGAHDPWTALPPRTVATTRAAGTPDRGFPSGHVASATAFAFGLWALFPWRGAGWFAAIWIPVMALSRMTLGKHFAADVLAGFAIGLGFAWLGVGLARRLEAAPPRPSVATAVLVGVATTALLGASVGVGNTPRLLGSLAGAAVAAAVLGRWPAAARAVPASTRWIRLAVAAAIYAVGTAIAKALGGGGVPLVEALVSAVPVGAALTVPMLLASSTVGDRARA